VKRSLFPSLPQGWRSVPAKHAAALNPEVLPESTPEDTELSYVDIAALEGGDAAVSLSPKALTFRTAPSRARRVLRQGDTILSTVRTYLKAVANFPEASEGLVASTGFAVLRPNGQLNPRFAYWAALSEPFIENVVAHSEGVSYPAINPSVLGSLHMPVPPLIEQQRIANFLDEQTARIDALIAEKERLLGELLEYRKSVISQATTRGLNKGARTQKTEQEWLGEIPAHWKLTKLKYLGEAIIGLTYSPEDVNDTGAGVLVLRSSNVQAGRIVLTDNVYVSCEIPEKIRVRAGDILICSRNGSRALIGKNALIGTEHAGMSFGAFMTVFRSPENYYVRWLLNSPLFDFHSASFLTSTINQLTTGNLNSLLVPLPPKEERQEIDAYLSARSEEFDALSQHIRAHVDHLREYRSSLISAAVTGQLDLSTFKATA